MILAQFVFRRNTCEDDFTHQRVAQRRFIHAVQFSAGDNPGLRLADNANAPGDAFCRQTIIASDHDNTNPAVWQGTCPEAMLGFHIESVD
ncbi:MAG: hypothetical protein J7463_02930 [Roseiflexus sp.]|nr:hypothetical protein [Roseiflexus sp.]MBO9333795.1 hypothetical protein [Roseiflexus sp.]MBO9363538.1 hypothetical protein [Roseiflexus sp.]MBO9384172.1 hypothetical protein [Roseiflexus sp.]MBO9387778.1 hypothetical protein [Roseiflexus sp.]